MSCLNRIVDHFRLGVEIIFDLFVTFDERLEFFARLSAALFGKLK